MTVSVDKNATYDEAPGKPAVLASDWHFEFATVSPPMFGEYVDEVTNARLYG